MSASLERWRDGESRGWSYRVFALRYWRYTPVQLNGKQAKKDSACLEELCTYVKSKLEGAT